MDKLPKKAGKGNPSYRFELRGKIAMAGFRTVGEFGLAVGVDPAKLSRIVCGWEWPNEKVKSTMAEKLGISTDELQRIL